MILSAAISSRARMFLSRASRPFLAAFSSSSSCLFSISPSSSSSLLGNNNNNNNKLLSGSNHRLGDDSNSTTIGRSCCRYKHSERQINRLFRKHPARARVDARLGIERQKATPESIEKAKPTYEAVYHEAKILPNGWSKPPPDDFQRPQYPFSLARTKNKPNNAVGYLPVYAKFR
jgi:hypothetical protein